MSIHQRKYAAYFFKIFDFSASFYCFLGLNNSIQTINVKNMELRPKKQLNVELLQVEMSSEENSASCDTCDVVHNYLTQAVRDVQNLFNELGCEIVLSKKRINTVTEANQENIIATPTVRVGSFDFYPKHLSAFNEEREWNWNNKKINELDKSVLIEVILKGYLETQSNKQDLEISTYVQKYLKNGKENNCCTPVGS